MKPLGQELEQQFSQASKAVQDFQEQQSKLESNKSSEPEDLASSHFDIRTYLNELRKLENNKVEQDVFDEAFFDEVFDEFLLAEDREDKKERKSFNISTDLEQQSKLENNKVEDDTKYIIPKTSHSDKNINLEDPKYFKKEAGALLLKGLALTDQDIQTHVIPFLNAHPEVISLDLHFNKLGDESAIALSKNTSVILLDLSSNEIGDGGAIALSKNRSISYLNLMGNKSIDDGGLIALSQNTTMIKIEFVQYDKFFALISLRSLMFPVEEDQKVDYHRYSLSYYTVVNKRNAAASKASPIKRFVAFRDLNLKNPTLPVKFPSLTEISVFAVKKNRVAIEKKKGKLNAELLPEILMKEIERAKLYAPELGHSLTSV